MKKILLVEDDLLIAKSLKLSLSYQDFVVEVAPSLRAAEQALASHDFEFVILDVNLPDGTSFQFCEKVSAEKPEVPIIMLTARTDEESAVLGMKSGADDYVRKPFGVNELMVRMQKLMERKGRARTEMKFGPLRLDPSSRRTWVDERELELSKKEFDVLAELMRKKGEVVTRTDILNVFGQNNEIYDRTIDSHLSHLRKKLREAEAQLVSITPIYGVGYRLEIKSAASSNSGDS